MFTAPPLHALNEALDVLRVLLRRDEQYVCRVDDYDVLHADERDEPVALADDDAARAVAEHLCPVAEHGEGTAKVLKELGQLVHLADEDQRAVTELAFAAQALQAAMNQGKSTIQALIGGADGHTEAVRQRADLMLSFGKLTWPHMLARIMVLEQIYRAHAILANHPYHREG